MHILLTDRLTCPRCGPRFGLVLLAEEIQDRRVREGALGCPNCREQYPVRGGFGDLRAPPRSELRPPPEETPTPARDESVRVAALLGVTRGPGQLLLVGELAFHAPTLAELVEDVEVVAAHPDTRAWPEAPGVSRMALGRTVPVFPGSLRGVALDGAEADALLEAAAGAVASGGRVVVVDAPEEVGTRLEEQGLTVVANEPGVVVAARGGRGGTNVTFHPP